ncbi:hypothetical protein V6G10_004020 [Vibrio parahaemolyticus]|nr:hypothetical protein [Vibrio parahaemolyticus]MDG3384070.1 hypothetical protein [Vibrio parahaemolyticus]
MSKIRSFFNKWFDNAETVHYVALTTAIIGGALWAFYTFDVLHQKEKAEADLKEIQDRIRGTNASNISISADTFQLDEGKFGILASVNIQNTGTKDVWIDWSDEDTPLVIYKVRIEQGDTLFFEKLYRPKIYAPFNLEKKRKQHFTSLYLLVGAKKELSFYAEVEQEGMYYITFSAKTDDELEGEIKEKSGQTAEWFSSKYLKVEPKNTSKVDTAIKTKTFNK